MTLESRLTVLETQLARAVAAMQAHVSHTHAALHKINETIMAATAHIATIERDLHRHTEH